MKQKEKINIEEIVKEEIKKYEEEHIKFFKKDNLMDKLLNKIHIRNIIITILVVILFITIISSFILIGKEKEEEYILVKELRGETLYENEKIDKDLFLRIISERIATKLFNINPNILNLNLNEILFFAENKTKLKNYLDNSGFISEIEVEMVNKEFKINKKEYNYDEPGIMISIYKGKLKEWSHKKSVEEMEFLVKIYMNLKTGKFIYFEFKVEGD